MQLSVFEKPLNQCNASSSQSACARKQLRVPFTPFFLNPLSLSLLSFPTFIQVTLLILLCNLPMTHYAIVFPLKNFISILVTR